MEQKISGKKLNRGAPKVQVFPPITLLSAHRCYIPNVLLYTVIYQISFIYLVPCHIYQIIYILQINTNPLPPVCLSFLNNKFSIFVVWLNKQLFYGFELSSLEDLVTFITTRVKTQLVYLIFRYIRYPYIIDYDEKLELKPLEYHRTMVNGLWGQQFHRKTIAIKSPGV